MFLSFIYHPSYFFQYILNFLCSDAIHKVHKFTPPMHCHKDCKHKIEIFRAIQDKDYMLLIT